MTEQNAGEGPGLLRGLSEMPGSGKFNFNRNFWGLKAWPISSPLCVKENSMAKKELNSVKEILFWSYANLAMAHTAVDRKQEKYATFNYMIRSKLFKGLMEGSMNIRSLFDDEKIKLLSGNKCSYCGSSEKLALDHIFSQKMGGKDTGDNLIYACKHCNSSKGKKDLMEWMNYKNKFPPLMVLRRYLKLVVAYCAENRLMECSVDDLKKQKHPFSLHFARTKIFL